MQPTFKPPCDALLALSEALDSAPKDRLVHVGRKYAFGQLAMPPGLLAVVFSRCAAVCGPDTTLWRDAMTTSVGGNASSSASATEIAIRKDGPSTLLLEARCESHTA